MLGPLVTELFFDEPTRSPPGTGPCSSAMPQKRGGLCRKKWREARRLSRPPYAAEMDDQLHADRLVGRAKRLHRRDIDELPDGAFAAFDGAAFAIRGDTLMRWTPEGYGAREPRPRHIGVDHAHPAEATLAVLSAGYQHTLAPQRKGLAFVVRNALKHPVRLDQIGCPSTRQRGDPDYSTCASSISFR